MSDDRIRPSLGVALRLQVEAVRALDREGTKKANTAAMRVLVRIRDAAVRELSADDYGIFAACVTEEGDVAGVVPLPQ